MFHVEHKIRNENYVSRETFLIDYMVVSRETLVKFNKLDCLKNASKYVAGNSKVFHTPFSGNASRGYIYV